MAKKKSTGSRRILAQVLALQDMLDAARNAVFVCAEALTHGDTDLELRSSEILHRAASELDEVSDTMSGARIDARWPQPAASQTADPAEVANS